MKNKIAIIISALAIILVASFMLNILSAPSVVINKKIKPPVSASSDFSGVMLSTYDNVRLKYYEDKVVFDFDDVKVKDSNGVNYDFVVLDFIDLEFGFPDSISSSFTPVFNKDFAFSTQYNSDYQMDYDTGETVYPSYLGGMFQTETVISTDGAFKATYTYLFDFRQLNEGKFALHTYLNGNFNFSKTVSVDNLSLVFENFVFDYGTPVENYGFINFGSIYLYGFETGSNSALSSIVSNKSLPLTSCEDSLLYGK